MVRRLLLTVFVVFTVGIWGRNLVPLLVSAAGAEEDVSKTEDPLNGEEYYELYGMLADAIDQVERNYVKPISRRELMEAAVEGIVGKLDAYSSYISPEEINQFRSGIDSEFGGIGIQVIIDDGQLTVLSPIVNTPAYRAGIRAGDRIVKIGDKSTEGVTLDDAVEMMKGPIGSSVTIRVLHPDEPKPEKLTLNREMVHVSTVLGYRRNEDDSWNYLLDKKNGIGYIRISAFSRETAKELSEALAELQREKARALILDLRFNPGGLLKSAIEISDLFLAEGRIVSTEGRNTQERIWDAHQEGPFEQIPLVVLVNRYSASASEILAACLQDHKRALVIGERTWGKGSVQNVIELEGGKSALKLTTASYLRPSGKSLHRFPDSKEWGVNPDKGYELALPSAELRSLMRHQRRRDLVLSKRPVKEPQKQVGAPPEPPEEEPTAPPEFVDRQLDKAVEYLTHELATQK